MFKVSFEGPKFGITDEVKDLFKKKKDKKDAPLKLWTHKERVVVGVILALTLLGSAYFWYSGQNRLPSIDFGSFGFEQKVILEK